MTVDSVVRRRPALRADESERTVSDQPLGASRRDLFKLSAFGLGAGATAAMFPGFAAAGPGDDLPEPDTGLDYYLKLGTIQGSSTAERFPHQIQVTSWDWGAATAVSAPAGGGATVGKAKAKPFKFLTRTDIHTPKAFEAMVKGTALNPVTLNVVHPEATFSSWTVQMNTCFITEYENFPGSDGVPRDIVELVYRKITLTYRPQLPQGGPGTPVTFGWDFAANKAI
jgi:type VI protein secretion system component Hcp